MSSKLHQSVGRYVLCIISGQGFTHFSEIVQMEGGRGSMGEGRKRGGGEGEGSVGEEEEGVVIQLRWYP